MNSIRSFFFFPNFGMARVAPKRLFCFTKNCIFAFVSTTIQCFHFYRIKKDMHWNFATICRIFSPWTPIWNHFVHFWMIPYQNNPRLSWSLQFALSYNKRYLTLFAFDHTMTHVIKHLSHDNTQCTQHCINIVHAMMWIWQWKFTS